MNKGLFLFKFLLVISLLMASNAQAQMVSLVKDINPTGSAFNSGQVAFNEFVLLGNVLLFKADNGAGKELWRTDGTEAGTYILKKIGTTSKGSRPNTLYAYNGAVFFWADDNGDDKFDLWKTDGTEVGTVVVKRFNLEAVIIDQLVITCEWGIVDNKLQFFIRTNSELWQTNGTDAGTQKLVSFQNTTFEPFVHGMVVNNTWLIFQNEKGEYALWRSQGSTQSTYSLYKTKAIPRVFFQNENFIYLNFGNGILKSDGTTNGTNFVFDSPTIPSTGGLVLSSGVVYSAVNSEVLRLDEATKKFTSVSSNKDFLSIFDVAGDLYATNGGGSSSFAMPLKLYRLDKLTNKFRAINFPKQLSLDVDGYKISRESFISGVNRLYLVATYGTTRAQAVLAISKSDTTSKIVGLVKKKIDDPTLIVKGAPLDEEIADFTRVGDNVFYISKEKVDNINRKDIGTELWKMSLCEHTFEYVTPIGTSFCPGGSVPISVSVTGQNSPFTYDWVFQNSATYLSLGTTKDITAARSGAYTVYVSDSKGCITEQVGLLIEENTRLPVLISGSNAICTGSTLPLSVSASGGIAPYTYQWKQSGINISSATSSTLAVTTTGTYSVSATDSKGCTGLSTDFPVTEKPGPTATITANGPTVVQPGGNLSVTLTTPATVGQTYQWYRDGQSIAGATTNTYVATQVGDYTLFINRNGCTATSKGIRLAIGLATSIAGGNLLCAGQSTTLTANVVGGTPPYTYQWRLNGIGTGGNASTLAVSTAGNYIVTTTDSKSVAGESSIFMVTQKPSPTATITTSTGSTSYLNGNPVTLSTPTATAQTYQWLKDNQPIAGATNNTQVVGQPGSYAVVVTRDGCSTTSTAVTINLITAIELGTSGIGMTISPNPASDVCQIKLILDTPAPANIQLLDARGRAVRQWSSGKAARTHETIFSLTELPTGTYLLRATANDRREVTKLLKN